MNRPPIRGAGLAVACLSFFILQPGIATAQPARDGGPEQSLTSTTFDADLLRNLPTADSLFAVLETLEPKMVTDRFTSGGLGAGQPARVGGFLASWRHTRYEIDGVPITDPTGNGAPMLIPDLSLWDRVRVDTGFFGDPGNMNGLSIRLTPGAPTETWRRTGEVSFSHGGLASPDPGAGAPPIARLDGWDHVSFAAGGPLTARTGGVFAGSWTRDSEFARDDDVSAESHTASLFSQLVFAPNLRDRIRVLGWVQGRQQPLTERAILDQQQSTTSNLAGHGQVVWERTGPDHAPRRAFGSFSMRRESNDADLAGDGVAERLIDGPISQFASLADTTVRTWSLGARVSPTSTWHGRDHRLALGADLVGGHSRSSAFFSGDVGELMHGGPARVWSFHAPGQPSVHSSIAAGAYASDTVALTGSLEGEASVRIDFVHGSAADANTGVTWVSALPHASLRWTVSERHGMVGFVSYARSAAPLLLDDLAYGDPYAPTADVYRWNQLAGVPPELGARGPIVARVGPGTGGDPNFSAIDSSLKRPTSDEVIIGGTYNVRHDLAFQLTGVARADRHLLGVVNVGAPAGGSYTTFTVNDPGGDVLSPNDDRVLTIYNRLPASFAKDRYLLTNPDEKNSAFAGLELSLRFTRSAFTLFGGGTAGLAEAQAANRGFGPFENEPTVLGELFTDPNATSLARGRAFADRAFTAKFGGVAKLPADFRVGFIARYQDGQPFSRVVVFPGLNQGADAVRAFPNGDSRFMFIGTLDVRVQKTFSVGGRHVDAIFDAYNLPGRSNSVEEDIAAAPNVRVPTAVQPPRAIHLGARVSF